MHKKNEIVISNTTPIICLSILDKLDLLKYFYSKIIIPEAVHNEIIIGRKNRYGYNKYRESDWIEIRSIKNQDLRKYYFDLDIGEAEVLVLADELNADLVIIDEFLGRKYAELIGLNLTGTLGILLKAKTVNKIEAVKPLIEKLQQEGIWLSDSLIKLVLKKAGE